jgi:hypothetical protein
VLRFIIWNEMRSLELVAENIATGQETSASLR